jgi:hypothetical protein
LGRFTQSPYVLLGVLLPLLQEQEIAAVKWMPVQEYTSHAIFKLTVHYPVVVFLLGASLSRLLLCWSLPCLQEREIAAVKWMPVQEYTSQAYFQKLPAAYHTMMERCTAWAEGRYKGMTGRVFDGSTSRPRRDLLMWGDVDDGPAAAAAGKGVAENGNGVAAAEQRAAAVVGANGLLN